MTHQTPIAFPLRPNSIQQSSPVHPRFAIGLMVQQVVSKPPRGSSIAGWSWLAKRSHIRAFLEHYLAKYKTLPSGILDAGKTRMPLMSYYCPVD